MLNRQLRGYDIFYYYYYCTIILNTSNKTVQFDDHNESLVKGNKEEID